VTLDPPTRGRVVDAAGDYLAGATVETEGWFGKHTHPGWVVAAWHAWDLVLAKDPDEVEALPAERWADWTPLLLDTMLGKGPRHLHCLGLAWERARTAWLDAYDRLAEAADHAADWIRLRSHAEACWDDALAAHLLELLDREILPGEGRRALLGLLLERDVDAARAWAGGHLSEEGVAATLLRQAHDAGWPELARHMETDPDLFARALEEAVDRGDYEHAPGRLLERLPSPGAAGDLAAWLMERYPPEGDPDFDGVHVVGSREEMGWFRGRVIDWLKASGHAEELDRLAERFSERRWLREIARDAAITAAGAAWSPPTLRELARLEQRAEARFVHDGAHLLELTLAAIDRIQAEALSGELAVARNLYDETPDGGRRPMDEPTLSDWLAYELKRRLEAVVVNREVQIGAHHGRTDIRLDALGPDSPPLTVQIEVKGAWHRDVRSALRTQLVDDYLSHYPRGHGLYVVFWFDLDDWDAGDRRRRAARRHFPTADEAQTALDRQAEEASAATPHRVRAKVLRVTRRPAAE